MALIHALPSTAQAETRVEGAADALTVEAHHASIKEVLAALGATYGVQVHGASGLDAVVDGTYQGSLQRVIGRLLIGSSYVAKSSAGILDVTILGAPNDAPAPGPTKRHLPFFRDAASSSKTSIANQRDAAGAASVGSGLVAR